MADRVPVILVTGTVGSGKTTIAYEMNDALAELEIPNAALDLDGLAVQWPPSSPWNEDLVFENLALLWPSYAAHGATHLVLARVLEARSELDRYRAAVPGADITVARLLSPEAVRLQRLADRMPPGPSREWHLARTVELEDILDAAGLEDFVVDNEGRSPREVALEVLRRAEWI